MNALTIEFPPTLTLSNAQFAEICRHNRDLRFERTARGALIVMPPTGSNTGKRNSDLNLQLAMWNRRTGLGVTFDSSVGFTLPNRAIRSPDASWIARDRWNALSDEEKEGFAPICPDFVVELRSPSDRLADLQVKMQEYLENGVRLAWLLDPSEKRAQIYRPGRDVETIENAIALSGEDILPGFELDLSEIFA